MWRCAAWPPCLPPKPLKARFRACCSSWASIAGRTVSILSALRRAGRVITMPYEWTGPGKTASGTAVGFGAAARAVPAAGTLYGAAQTGVFVPQPAAPAGRAPGGLRCTRCCKKERVEGFLCMENARRHADDAALVNALLPLLQREPERFSRSGGHGGGCGPADGHAGPARLPGHRGRLDARALYFAGGGLPGYPGHCRHQRQPRLCLRQPAAVVCLPGHGRCVRPGPAFSAPGRRSSSLSCPTPPSRCLQGGASGCAPSCAGATRGTCAWALPGPKAILPAAAWWMPRRRSMAAERVGVPPGPA